MIDKPSASGLIVDFCGHSAVNKAKTNGAIINRLNIMDYPIKINESVTTTPIAMYIAYCCMFPFCIERTNPPAPRVISAAQYVHLSIKFTSM